MRSLFLAFLIGLQSAPISAQMTYRCPPVYPGKDAPPLPLTSAFMDSGEVADLRTYAPPRGEAAEEGYDLPYSFSDEEQAWLVCSYGGKERIKGRFHDGHEWNQRVEGSVADWWIELPPRAGMCLVQVREGKARDPKKSRWMATATCGKG